MDFKKFFLIIAALFILFLQPLWQKTKLNPQLPPGGNFDLSLFKLQLPVGPADKPQEILPSNLMGKNGFTNTYFYTDATDGAMVMMVPETGVTLPGTNHCGTELSEMPEEGWLHFGNHTLEATLRVPQVHTRIVIGQIFQVQGSRKPLCELEYNEDGKLELLLNQTPDGDAGIRNTIGQVKPGQLFKYLLALSDKTLTVNLDGSNTTFNLPHDFAGRRFYFKTGNYDQASRAGEPGVTPWSQVYFYQLSIGHEQ